MAARHRGALSAVFRFSELSERMVVACSYVIDQNICFLTLADKGYPKKLAFAYLEEIKEGFAAELYHDHGEE